MPDSVSASGSSGVGLGDSKHLADPSRPEHDRLSDLVDTQTVALAEMTAQARSTSGAPRQRWLVVTSLVDLSTDRF